MNAPDAFEELVAVIVTRFFAQNFAGRPAVAETKQFTAQLRQLIAERGLPPPLPLHEIGAPGGMSDEACAPLVARVSDGLSYPAWADLARQLVKACLYPEFRICRDSFREVARDGSCRRQQIERVRTRISGSHCVDCPHWIALGPERHAEYLQREWRGDPAVFTTQRNVFLPEDFRALRRWLYSAARG